MTVRTLTLAGGEEIVVHRDAVWFYAEYRSRIGRCVVHELINIKTIQAALDYVEATEAGGSWARFYGAILDYYLYLDHYEPPIA